MITIDQAVDLVAAGQSPVLCLDTCDFLDVVRGVAEGNLYHVQAFRVMLTTLDLAPGRFHLAITYLVRHEWKRNKVEVERRVEKFLDETKNDVGRIAEAKSLGELPEMMVDPNLFEPDLAKKLIDLAENVMNHAMILERNNLCVNRALERVMDGRRPSHRNEIKDSIHWEHFLELSRLLAASGHTQDRWFVSANKADFWEQGKPSIHTDLKDEASAAGLQFSGKLDEAVRKLGIGVSS